MPLTNSGNDFSNDHIEEAKDNYERYLRLLEDDRDIDWALVILFYSALHLVQAHAERHAPKITGVAIPMDHHTRNDYVKRQLSEIYDEYMLLQNASKDARYKRIKRTREKVIDLHDNFFEPIKSGVARRNIKW